MGGIAGDSDDAGSAAFQGDGGLLQVRQRVFSTVEDSRGLSGILGFEYIRTGT